MKYPADIMIERGRQDLILKQPFYGSLLIRLEPKKLSKEIAKAMQITDFATDGIHLLYYEPGVDKLTEDEVIGTMAHETLHCALRHMFRMRNRQLMRWNVACDYPINHIVQDSNLKMPADSLFDNRYKDMNAEQIYSILEKKEQEGEKPKKGRISVVAPPEGMTEEQQDSLDMEWKTATIQAAITAKTFGTLPGSLEQLLKEIDKVVFPWREILASFLMKTRPSRSDWARPSRRSHSMGFFLPNRYREPTGDLVIAHDTSASVSDIQLSEGYAETRGLIQQIQPERVILIQCDTRIRQVDEYDADSFPENISEILIKGRGGTSFDPPFEYCKENDINPDALIYFTDGECMYPNEEPGFPVLWMYTYEQESPPPFGEYLWMDI